MSAAPTPTAVANATALVDQALGLMQLGQMDTAESLCRKVIEAQPQHPEALHVLGVVALQKGRAETGAEFIRRSLESNPAQAHVHCSLGNALRDLGRPADAIASYRRALQLAPDFAGAMYGEGNALMDLDRAEEALQRYQRTLSLQPDFAEAHLNHGNALLRVGRLEDALVSYQQALAQQPHMTKALGNCIGVLWKLRRLEEALNFCDRLSALQVGDPEVLIDRGILLYELERYEEAIASLDAALLQRPDAAGARFCRANARQKLKQFERALTDYDLLLERNATLAEVHCSRGLTLLGLERPADALASFVTAVRLAPGLVEATDGKGSALRELNRLDEALTAFEHARELAPGSPDIQYRCALTLRQLGRHADTAAAFAAVLRLAPQYDYAAGSLLHERMLLCDWTAHQELVSEIRRAVLAGCRACLPGIFLSVADSAQEQLQCARTYAADKHPQQRAPHLLPVTRRARQRICVAYVSGDFREHPVSHLMAGVFEHHDRERFETLAISLRPADESPLGRRVRAAFPQFIDVSARGDAEAAAVMRELEVDIAVDLMGFSSEGRPGLFSARAAPVQVSFLGHPGTLGSPCYDYILADRHVVSEADRVFFQEKVVWLPHCFQPNDARRRMAAHSPTRAECGLSQEGFVFCCFNGHYKIDPTLFDVWMRLLHGVEGSVLWLASGDETAMRNLRHEAARRGVAPQRLVFAARLPDVADHLARYRHAGLFLDTIPFNAHTTASDALWAGVPLVTCRGNAFAARVSASLLNALRCPELVTANLHEYEALAQRIATTPALAGELRARLESTRVTTPLFDTARYCRDLESAYISMWERCQRGEAPQHFAVD
ncbi:MAG TPA: tetratricopeptide repeat protein [Steroidobacteraceae bacterium]|nr:tetratricopeptide repeat protein [Steroidobacteraceae bacterium]